MLAALGFYVGIAGKPRVDWQRRHCGAGQVHVLICLLEVGLDTVVVGQAEIERKARLNAFVGFENALGVVGGVDNVVILIEIHHIGLANILQHRETHTVIDIDKPADFGLVRHVNGVLERAVVRIDILHIVGALGASLHNKRRELVERGLEARFYGAFGVGEEGHIALNAPIANRRFPTGVVRFQPVHKVRVDSRQVGEQTVAEQVVVTCCESAVSVVNLHHTRVIHHVAAKIARRKNAVVIVDFEVHLRVHIVEVELGVVGNLVAVEREEHIHIRAASRNNERAAVFYNRAING